MDKAKIPGNLHSLIAIAEEWGGLSQTNQDRKLSKLERENPAEALKLRERVELFRPAIRAWSKSLTELDKHTSEMTKDDWAHPYWNFLSLLKVVDSIDWDGDEENADVQAARKRFQREQEQAKLQELRRLAQESFVESDFARTVDLLNLIGEKMTPAEKKKLAFCEKK